MFDVSHMTVVDVDGSEAQAYLLLLANDVARLKTPGKALYSGMLNEQGGVIDDLIVYLAGDGYAVWPMPRPAKRSGLDEQAGRLLCREPDRAQ